MRQTAILLGALLLASTLSAIESARTFVFLQPEASSFWRTATGSKMNISVDFPDGATCATLTIRGLGLNASYDIEAGTSSFDLSLPEPTRPSEEDVYELTLAFDNGVSRTARLGLLQGRIQGAVGQARCLVSDTEKAWKLVERRAVIPIPFGTTSFEVNGVLTDTGLDGAQGWYAISGVSFDNIADLTLVADGISHVASLRGPKGMVIAVR